MRCERTEGKDAYIERVIQQKWELFKSTKDTCKDPTAPLTPKMSKRVFELRALLTNLSRARHPTKFQLEEGERFKVELHELEDEAHARHATLQPAWYKLKERECKEELKAMRAKHAQLKRPSRQVLRIRERGSAASGRQTRRVPPADGTRAQGWAGG